MSLFKLGKLSIDAIAYGSQGNAVLGIRDSGKTYTATYLAERLFDAGIPFITFDPVGVWRFLRVPGKGKGYPIVVAGGAEGDLPLTVEGAPEIVRAAMRNGVSLVIDLFDINLSKADWRRIVLACVNVLLHENKAHGLRHVFIEEAAEFIPQKPIDGMVYAAVEKLARMGGNSRLGYTLINQRSQEVAKAVLELCENVFLHRQRGKNALENMDKWLSVAGEAEKKEILKTLPSLPQGECWAWLGGDNPTPPLLVKVPAKNSLHPDRRVMHGDKGIKPAGAIDVSGFVTSMRTTLVKVEAEAKANNPKFLKAEIARLTRELAAKPSAPAVDTRAIHDAAYLSGISAGRSHILGVMRELGSDIEAALRKHATEAARLADKAFDESQKSGSPPSQVHRPPAKLTAPTRAVSAPRGTNPSPAASGDGSLTNPQRQLLKALAWWAAMGHDNPSRPQVAAIAGWKVTAGHLRNVVGSLNAAGLTVSQNGHIALTETGIAAAPEPDMGLTLVDGLRGVLSNPQKQLFEVLIERRSAMARADLATSVGWDANAGHLRNVIGSMRTLEIIDYPHSGMVELQSWVTG